MLCNTCTNLASLNAKRVCLRCKGTIYSNLAVICDNCSKNEKMCAVCLKKMYESVGKIRPKSNCSTCGGGK